MDCTLTEGISVKLPISAMVVGYNEAGFLKQCLQSISFCEEIFYTDLGSADSSIQIAKTFGCQIERHAKVPSCEMIQTNVVHRLKHNWVIFIDPDERVDFTLGQELIERFSDISKSSTIGAVMVPWQFYFRHKPLKGTVWGGLNKKFLLVHKERFVFEPIVHYGRRVLPEFDTVEFSYNGCQNVLHHYWMNSPKVFMQKHIRYLKNEAIDRFNAGKRQSVKTLILVPFREFNKSFFKMKGYKDGLTGFFLSAFWAFYETRVTFGIVRLQRKNQCSSSAK